MGEYLLYWPMSVILLGGAIFVCSMLFLEGGPVRLSLNFSLMTSGVYSLALFFMHAQLGFGYIEKTIIGNWIFFSANAMVFAFGVFSLFFTGQAEKLKEWPFLVFSFFAIVFAVGSGFGLFVKHFPADPDVPVYSNFSKLFIGYCLFFAGPYVFGAVLYRSYRQTNDPVYRFQVASVLWSGFISAAGILVSNGIMPQFLGRHVGVYVGALFVLIFYAVVLAVLVNGEVLSASAGLFRFAYAAGVENRKNCISLIRMAVDLKTLFRDAPFASNSYEFFDRSERSVRVAFQGATANVLDGLYDHIESLRKDNLKLLRERQNAIDAHLEAKTEQSLGQKAISHGKRVRGEGIALVERMFENRHGNKFPNGDSPPLIYENAEIEWSEGYLVICDSSSGIRLFAGTVIEREIFLADGQLELDAFHSPQPGIYWKYRVKFQFLEK